MIISLLGSRDKQEARLQPQVKAWMGVSAKNKEERRAPLLLTTRRTMPLPPARCLREPIGRAGALSAHTAWAKQKRRGTVEEESQTHWRERTDSKERIPLCFPSLVGFFILLKKDKNYLKSHWEMEDLGNMPVVKGTFRYLHWSKVRAIHGLSISRLSSSGGSWSRTSVLRRQPWTFQFLGLLSFFYDFNKQLSQHISPDYYAEQMLNNKMHHGIEIPLKSKVINIWREDIWILDPH